MQKFILLSLCLLLLTPYTAVQGQGNVLRTGDSIVVENAKIASTNVLADPKGLVYMEIVKGTYVLIRETETRFTGEILPPSVIRTSFYDKKPKGRIRDILAFEITSDTLEPLWFLDKLRIMHQKNRDRAAILAPETLINTKIAKVIIPLFQDYGKPALWEFLGRDEDGKDIWKRMGGKREETKEEVDLFVATLDGTGTFVLFDENPAPDASDTFIPYEKIQLAPQGPYTSVQPNYPETTPASDTEFDPSFIPYDKLDGEVNFPINDNDLGADTGNPLIVKPLDNNGSLDVNLGADLSPLENQQLGAFGVPRDRLGIPGNFNFNRTDTNAVLDADGNIIQQPIETDIPDPNTTEIDASLGAKNALTENEASADTSGKDRKLRIDDLITERLLGTNTSGTSVLFETEDVKNTTGTSDTTIESALLGNTPTESQEIRADAASALLSSAPERDEPTIEDVLKIREDTENIEIPEGDLPKTGNTNNRFLMFLAGLIFVLGLGSVWWVKRPHQMKMRIK